MTTLRELRDIQGWSQAMLAAQLGISPSTVYNWEAGKTEPRPRQLRALERLFNVPMGSIALVEQETAKKELAVR
jgi:transcriptional regulator with XRE-family HTH domain